MIDKSKNVKTEIKQLFKKAAIENFGGKGFSRNNFEILSLYRLRNKLLKKKGTYSEVWADLLNRLAENDDYSQVYLTPLNINNKMFVVFSDKDYEECFGMIYKDW
ncbi:hypothetical protein [uncultured Mucilaginibacter sp.]|uniref:hypothetical protein n=1 Tax=uncultured Mucilaginibacter sp. TaxID=797541 RepID=UPI0025FBFD13|nr:hypothetical protein [uncultured Mucilaginibacter sp.]